MEPLHIISAPNRHQCKTIELEMRRRGIKFERQPLYVSWTRKEDLQELRGKIYTQEEFDKYCHGYFTDEMKFALGL